VLILALDTTTRAGSVAVTDDDTLLALVHGDAARTHGERLPGEIERALAAAGVTAGQLTLLAVASGPGAFTGLRIGLAAIQGMAMVLDIPVIGVSALDALASDAWTARRDGERHVIAWMDAQRGEVFAADYVDPWNFDGAGEPHGEPPSAEGGSTREARPTGAAGPQARHRNERAAPIVGSPEAVLAAMTVSPAGVICVGDGAVRYRADLEARFHGRCRVVDTPGAIAPAVARIGRQLALAGYAGRPHALQPLYVRRPDAELERQRRSALIRPGVGEAG
jgi:tRNA threonylcarbamoyladenosine biosynthesis protein TsaB